MILRNAKVKKTTTKKQHNRSNTKIVDDELHGVLKEFCCQLKAFFMLVIQTDVPTLEGMEDYIKYKQ